MVKSADSVRIAIYNQANLDEFVALSEADDPDNLKLPGGKFEGEETPDEAASRELMEELGVTPEQVGLKFAGELVNDDGVSRRYIYTGTVDLEDLRPSEEIHHTEMLTLETIPEGQNKRHILAAIMQSRTVLK